MSQRTNSEEERRSRVAEWLRGWSTDLADLYLAAVRLLHGPQDVPAHLRLTAHAAREILNRLPDFVEPAERRRLEYPKLVASLEATVPDLPLESSSYVLQGPALDALRLLLTSHQSVRENNTQRAWRMFKAATRSAQPELLIPLARQWHELYGLFVHDVHVADAAATAWTAAEYRDRFGRVEAILATLADDFFAPLVEMDAILADPQATLDDALTRAVHPEQLRYLFEKLERPEWVAGLSKKGYFQSPPSPIEEEGGNLVRFPPWPALGYLARMAARAPDDVLKAVLTVPSTENLAVRAGLLDVVRQLPPEHAAKFVPNALVWLRGNKQFHTIIEHRLEPLIGHLAAREPAAAEKLLVAAASLLPPDSEYAAPRTRLPLWSYARLFAANLSSLLAADGDRFFKRFVELLRNAVKIASTRQSASPGRGVSTSWRETIGSSDGEHYDPRDVLVDAVRDAALFRATDAASTVRTIAELEAETFSIFRRIALYVTAERHELARDLAVAYVLRRDLFDGHEFRPEYARLVALVFGELSEPQRGTWLGWVEQGPDLPYLDRWHEPGQDGPSLELIKREHRERWQLDRLALVADGLSGDWAERYRRLVERGYGAPEDPRHPRAHDVWVGPTSPFDIAELKSLGVEALVSKLRAWVPSDDWMTPTPVGVGRQLTELVSADPVAYAETDKLALLEPTYVRSILEGFAGALSADRALPWNAVVYLIEAVLSNPFVHEHDDDHDRDTGWRWARMSAARLLETGFARKAFPYELRSRLWTCVETLLNDADPTSAEEAERVGRGADVADMSVNATRSIAIDAALHYGMWARHHFGADAFTLEAAPELRSALERHLDATHEPSRAVRWVVGRWFRSLAEVDRAWAAARVTDVFGDSEDPTELAVTAWNAFLSSSSADRTGFALLAGYYRRAVEHLGQRAVGSHHRPSLDELLAHHLVRLFWLGIIELEGEASLLRRFYDLAPAALRGHVIDFVGRSLRSTKKTDIPLDIASRLRELWEIRVQALVSTEENERAAELKAFGWWFAAGNLGVDWLLNQLQSALELHAQIDASMLVVEKLDELVRSHPEAVLTCLGLLIQGDRIGWDIGSWKQHAMNILRITIGNDGTSAQARALVNELGRRGFHEFRSLLDGDEA